MITYEKLNENSKAFNELSGLTLDEFDDLYESFATVWMEAEETRLDRPDRHRALGGGGQYTRDLRTQLAMVILWLRLYLTTEAVGLLFGLHKSTVSRNGRRIWQVLRQVREPKFVWPAPPKRGHGRTIEQAFRDYPDLYALLDAPELPVQWSQEKETPPKPNTSKKKPYARKTTNVVDEEWTIQDNVPSTPGYTHKFNHPHGAGFVEKIPKDKGELNDANGDDLNKELPDPSVATSHKARGNHPLADDVASRLRDAIIGGRFKPGQPLREKQLATMFQLSRGPVREALTRLEREGLVQVRRHRGTTVSLLSPSDVEEVYTLRLALERLAVQNAVARATDRDFAALEEVIAAFDKALAEDPSEHEIARLDLQFHDIIYKAARHQRLHNSWTNLRSQIYIFLLSRNIANQDFRDLTIAGHTAILNVLRARDEEQALLVIEEHLTAAYERVVVDFARHTVDEATPKQAQIYR